MTLGPIYKSDGGGGDISNAANVGGGTFEWFAQKNGDTLEFKTFNVTANGIQVSELGDLLTFSLQQDLRDTASPLFANVNIRNNGGLRTGQTNGDVALLQAYDVDGGVYKSLLYLVAGNLPTISIYDFSAFQGVTGGTASISTGLNAVDAILISAFDVDGAVFVPFITLVAGNNPTCNLADTVTKANQYIYRAAGTDVPVTDGGTGASTAAGARTNLGCPTVYQNQTIKLTSKIWNGVATTAGGVATFFPTDDNLITGNALFTNIYAAQVTASANVATAITVPVASVQLIAANKKSVTTNAIVGRNLVALGDTVAFAPDGTTVYLTLIGD